MPRKDILKHLIYDFGNFFVIYQQIMIMSFVNTEITSKHCDAMVFFPHTQKIIYHFKDNYFKDVFREIF